MSTEYVRMTEAERLNSLKEDAMRMKEERKKAEQRRQEEDRKKNEELARLRAELAAEKKLSERDQEIARLRSELTKAQKPAAQQEPAVDKMKEVDCKGRGGDNCWRCNQTLAGKKCIICEEHPYCIKCYEEVFAKQCAGCTKPIAVGSKDIPHNGKHWHEQCFLCSMCETSLAGKQLRSENDRIFCSNCHDTPLETTRCAGCNNTFQAGVTRTVYKDRKWHEKCFCCSHCRVAIGKNSFNTNNDDIFCLTCHAEKFAPRCRKCKKAIKGTITTYQNETFHPECFTCANCNSSLARQQLYTNNGKHYCSNCYGGLLAPRCTKCLKPIIGIGGVKFTTFEGRNWHNECFKCAQCATSLVGRGVIADGAKIMCPGCANARR